MSFSALSLARPAIVNMQAYQSARSQATSATGRIYLDANELSEGSPAELSRYPDPQPAELQGFLTKRLGVPAENLFLGAGVDDAIDALLRVFCEARQDSIVVTPPTYGYYKVAAAIQGADIIYAPLKAESFDLDEAAVIRSLTAKTKLVFVCNPNNPTGNAYDQERLLKLASEIGGRALLVVDEAYIEFTHRPSLASAAARPGNLVVLRTLSKAWGLAGVRLGAAVADPEVISLMHKVRAPYPIARPAVTAAMAELQTLTPDALAKRVAAVTSARQKLMTQLLALTCVKQVYPSESNFILIRTSNAASVMRCCAVAGIIVRDRSKDLGLADCVRISVGTEAENAALIAALSAGESP